MPDDTHIDLTERVAALEQMLVERTVERDAALNAKDVLSALRKMRERASLTAIVERALELTRFEAVMLGLPKGLQRAANVRKLMETAREFETHHFFGLGDFVRHLRRLAAKSGREYVLASRNLAADSIDVLPDFSRTSQGEGLMEKAARARW